MPWSQRGHKLCIIYLFICYALIHLFITNIAYRKHKPANINKQNQSKKLNSKQYKTLSMKTLKTP